MPPKLRTSQSSILAKQAMAQQVIAEASTEDTVVINDSNRPLLEGVRDSFWNFDDHGCNAH